MELLYVWNEGINKDKISEQGFNFGGKYLFEFDKQSLKVFLNQSFVKGFFNNSISNITALVGRNGAGKTSAIQAILKCAFNTRNYNPSVNKTDELLGKYIAVFLDNESIIIFASFEVEVEIGELAVEVRKYSVKRSSLTEENNLGNVLTCYFSSNNFREDSNSIFHNKWNSNIHGGNYSPKNRHSDQIVSVLKMVGKNPEVRRLVESEFEFPLEVSFSITGDYRDRLQKYIKEVDNRNPIRPQFYKKVNELFNYNYPSYHSFEKYLKTVILNYAVSLHSTAIDNNITEPLLEGIKGVFRSKNLLQTIDEFLSGLTSNFENDIKGNEKRLREVKELVQLITRTSIFEDLYISKYNMFIFPIYPFFFDDLIRFIELNVELFGMKNIHLAMRRCSSGEYAFLDVLAAFNEAVEKSEGKENIIFFLDEADTYFHPQWEKKYVKLLCDVIPLFYPDKKVQLVLSTNKPVILSDLPSDKVVYLEKKDNECRVVKLEGNRTFAQNIHTLYTDSFFLEGGLIGDFAKEKIRNTVSRLETLDNEEELASIEKIAELIGEPVIRERLLRKISDKRDSLNSSTNNIDEEIQSLEDRLKILRRRRNDKN